jgi:hypothetical protein
MPAPSEKPYIEGVNTTGGVAKPLPSPAIPGELTNQPCSVAQRASGSEDNVAHALKVSAGLAGDVDMELTLYADEPGLEYLARAAGFEEKGLEALQDSGRELLSTMAGRIADEMEQLSLRVEVLPHLPEEPLATRRPFDRRAVFDIRVGGAAAMLELSLRQQMLLRGEFPGDPVPQTR